MYWRSLNSTYPNQDVICLVEHHEQHEHRLLRWDAYREHWADEFGVYFCDKEDVSRWCPVAEIIKYLDEDDEMP